MVKLWDGIEVSAYDGDVNVINAENTDSKNHRLIIMLNGIRNMAKQEADNGSQSWAMVVEDIDRLLNE